MPDPEAVPEPGRLSEDHEEIARLTRQLAAALNAAERDSKARSAAHQRWRIQQNDERPELHSGTYRFGATN